MNRTQFGQYQTSSRGNPNFRVAVNMTERETGKAKADQSCPPPSEKRAFLARNAVHCTTVELQSQLTTVESVFNPLTYRRLSLSSHHSFHCLNF